ncbi:MAG: regulatory protein RecX [Nitrospira sp.]|nr:regulatory protein RecX [Nitrospira sp.]MBH0194521.1 regulatory protein RecX [Nitrospira sp.]
MRSERIGKQSDSTKPDQWMYLAIRYLARWDRTVAQVEQFLHRKGAAQAQIQQTISRLSDLRYLNDGAYAERWIESCLARRPMGRERLEAELLLKGVPEAVAGRAIRAVLRDLDEDALAHRALAGIRRTGRQLTPAQLVRLLRQRGFEEETIDRMIGDRTRHEECDR